MAKDKTEDNTDNNFSKSQQDYANIILMLGEKSKHETLTEYEMLLYESSCDYVSHVAQECIRLMKKAREEGTL